MKGEPLLHPSLGAFLDAAAGRGFDVSLTTNGTLVAETAPALLAAANLRKLSISLHSHIDSDSLEDYWRGVSTFLDLHRARPNFPVSLRLWNLRRGRLPPGTARLLALVQARYGLHAASALPTSIRLDQGVFLNQAEEFAWPGLELPRLGTRGFCRGLGNQVAILVDGTVVPCCLDGEGAIALGNILEAPLAVILASPRARAMREGFARRELAEPLCMTCGYRTRFD